jgi:hypothetical protein
MGGEYVAPAMKRFSDRWELVVSDPELEVEMYARRPK